MKVLIIYAHPRSDSFNHAVLERTEGLLAELQHQVKIRDLYKIGFDPRFSAHDQKLLAKGDFPPEIKIEQDYINWADALIIIHPIWWFGMPAILKGYIDRVFQAGFAYKYENGKVKGLLKDKDAFLINSTGTPDKVMEQNGIKQVLEASMDNGIYKFCGLNLKRLYLTAVPYVKKSKLEEYLDLVEKFLWQEFD